MTAPEAQILRAIGVAVRPLEALSPSAFAERHRCLKPGAGPISGRWSNTEPFPYLVPIMDAPAEAIAEGKRGVVLMKSTQGGGTDALGVNVPLWLIAFHPGPILYLTSKDDVAKEFVRDRWDYASAHCDPVARKALVGKRHGELVQVKRFLDSKLALTSSRSILNLLSQPYRFVILDEVDSIADEMSDGSDPIALAEKRTTAFAEAGATLVIAFAHPTVRERGAAALYYDRSDQRRGHVECPHCSSWVAPRPEQITPRPRPGQSPAEASRDPDAYAFACPSCGAEWSEADRLRAIRRVDQRSTLPPEVAAKREWIGLHFWAFFQPAMTVRAIAREIVEALDDPARMRVVVNKTFGEPFVEQLQDVTVGAWAKLALEEGAAGSYCRGAVPAEVQWLTAGQDSREQELHWAVWGWGLVRTAEKRTILCGWLVDWGIEDGPRRRDPRATTLSADDLAVLDQVLYARFWPRVEDEEQLAVAQGWHDSGWQPSAVYEYCRARLDRAVPTKGAAVDDASNAPLVRWSSGVRYALPAGEVHAANLRRADLNTFLAKAELAGLLDRTFRAARGAPRARLALPSDVAGEVLDHLASERLERDRRGRRRWVKRRPNHFLDCTVQAYCAGQAVLEALVTDACEHGEELAPRSEALIAESAARARRHEDLEDTGPPSPADLEDGPRRLRHPIRRRYS